MGMLRTLIGNLALVATTAIAIAPVALPRASRRADADPPTPPDEATARAAVRDAYDSSAAPRGDPAKRPAEVRTARDLIEEYAGRTPRDTLPQGGAPGDGSSTRAPLGDARPRVRTLIVVLPDPLDSRLDWLYDSGLESTRRALERDGYVLDRFWLPWTIDAERARHGGHFPAPPGIRVAYPGVLLFRGPLGGPKPELAIAWIVGESPTAGVHRAALDAAIADRDSLLAERRLVRAGAEPADDDACVLRVVGPIFSGSVPSLRQRLDAWLADDDARRAVVVSGGATGGRNRAIMTRADGRIVFQATVNPVDSLTSVLRTALHGRYRIPPQQIAYLTESNTAYGLMASRVPGGAPQSDDRIIAEADSAPLQIPFPMSISRLRTEYARHPAAAPTAMPVPGAPAPARLPLDLEDPASATENLPALSELTAPAIERTLDDIAQTLLAHKIRVVVIVATDVRDRLFIAHEVKRRLRDVKLALVGNHALYSRPEVNESLRGALVTSTYPLFLESQYWDPTHFAQRRREVFTSDLSEGTYNATLLQIGLARDMADYAVPGEPERLLRPPVWLMIVGRAGLAPVAAFPLRWSDRATPEPGACESLVQPTRTPRRAADSALYVAPRCDSATVHQARLAARRSAGIEPSVLQLGLDDWALSFTLLALFALTVLVAHATAAHATAARPSHGPARVGWPWRARDGVTLGAPPDAHEARPWGAAIRRVLLAAHPWPALRQDAARWRSHGATLALHASAWTVFRFIALAAVFAPLLVTLLRPRVHAVQVPGLLPVSAQLVLVIGLGLLLAPHLARLPEQLTRVLGRLRASDAERVASTPEDTAEAGMGALVALGVLLGAVVYVAAISRFLATVLGLDAAYSAPFLARYLQYFSGVTPLMPLVLGSALLLAWGTWHLQRTNLLGQAHAFETSPRADDAVLPDPRARLIGLTPGRASLVAFALLALLGVYVAAMLERSPESIALGPRTTAPERVGRSWPDAFELLYRAQLVTLLWALGWGLLRFAGVWGALRAHLRRVGDARWIGAMSRLPVGITRLTRLSTLGGPSARWVDDVLDAAARERWTRMRDADAERTARLLERMHQVAGGPLPTLSKGEWPAMRVSLAEEPAGAPRIGRALGVLRESLAPARPETTAPPTDDPRRLVPKPSSADAWQRSAEELVSLAVVAWVEWVVRQLRHLAVFLLVALALGALLLPCYPFEPQTLVKAIFFLLMALTIGLLLATLVQMNRDEVLSRIARTELGKVTWDAPFAINLVLVTLVPTLTVLGTQFPEVRDFLFSWVTPVLRAIGRG